MLRDLSLLIKLVVPNYKRDNIRFLINYRKSGLIVLVGIVEFSRSLVMEQYHHARDNPNAPFTGKCVLHSDNKELQIYYWCYIISLFITLQMLNSCKSTTVLGIFNIKRYSNEIKNNKKDTDKNLIRITVNIFTKMLKTITSVLPFLTGHTPGHSMLFTPVNR